MWTDATIVPPEELPQQQRVSRFDIAITSMRVHELGVQRWLNQRFLVAEGYPMPVLFTKPMSAYADFKQHWSAPNSVFSYLLEAKDREGRPLYQPHPAAPSYPLLTVNRQSWQYSAARSFSSHWWRHAGWPTVSSNVKLRDLGQVYQSRMPQAWDYRLQLDHYANRPDGQAYFIHELQQGFFPSAGSPNTWIRMVYPGVSGAKLVRVVLDGDIQDLTEEDPADNRRIYRTTVTLVVEGWVPDPNYLNVPAFWTMATNATAVAPAELEANYQILLQQDLRPLTGTGENGIVNSATNTPPSD